MQLVLVVPLYLGRRRLLGRILVLAFSVLPKEAAANFVERLLAAYIGKEEVDLGKGKLGVEYAATPRLKAILAVLAEPLMVEVMKKLQARIKTAKEGGAVGGLDIGGIIGAVMGGKGVVGGGSGGGLEQILPMIIQGFMGGSNQGGAGTAPSTQAPPRKPGAGPV